MQTQPSQSIETFATPGITPPAAFNRLRRALHDTAGPERIAEHRTRDTINQLRDMAKHLGDAIQLYAGSGLGYWYAELSGRLLRQANEIEAKAEASSLIGGEGDTLRELARSARKLADLYDGDDDAYAASLRQQAEKNEALANRL